MIDSETSLSVILTLSGCVALWLVVRSELSLPHLSKTRIFSAPLWLGLIWLLWVSDYPAAWRVPELVVYFAEPTLSAFRILCVTATGAVLFGGLVALLYLARPKSRRRPELD